MFSPLATRQLSSKMNASVRGMTHLIFGANTDVGKTVITAGLVRACKGLPVTNDGAHYIKPLQCGGSDQNFVRTHAPKETISATTLFEWESPTSPHAAARKENLPVSDEQVVTALQGCLANLRADNPHLPCWIETAGGVLSPSSSSPMNTQSWHATNDAGWGWMTQGDLYSCFKQEMDVIMIGDGRLGGISATLSALESLLSRGYNVTGLVLIEAGYSNQNAIREYASRSCPRPFGSDALIFNDPMTSVVSLPPLPPEPEPLMDWYESAEVSETLESFVKDHLTNTWQRKNSS